MYPTARTLTELATEAGEARDRAGFPIPRIYGSAFLSPPAWVMHWHWFWSAGTTLSILRPPPTAMTRAGIPSTPVVIDALARALLADVLADVEPSDLNGENCDER